MHTHGDFAPATESEARERYDRLGSTAQTVVRETTRAMAFDREEYDERVTPEVVGQVRDALFASLLEVTVGTREEFDAWREEQWAAEHDGEVVVIGSENVENVAWHAPPFAGEESEAGSEAAAVAVAATFQNEEDAAVDTLRRQAFGRIYRQTLRRE